MKLFLKVQMALAMVLVAHSVLATETLVQGVIRESECNGPSGLGVVFLEQVHGDVLERLALRVNSKKLCGTTPGAMNRLASIGYDAVFLGKTYLYELQIQNGYVIEMKEIGKVDYIKFAENVSQFRQIGDQKAMNWFFSGPAYIQYSDLDSGRVEQFVSRYTKN